MESKANRQTSRQKRFHRFYDLVFYFFDRLRKRILTKWDDLLFTLTRFFGPAAGTFFNSLSGVVTFTLERNEKENFLAVAAKVLLGIIVAIPIFAIGLTGVLIGGVFATILGMRNLGDYSFKEEFAAWAPLVLILISVPLWASPYFLGKLSLILCFSVLLVGLDFLYGQCGILTLGHAGFAYLGSFLAAFLYNGTFGWQFPFFLATLLSSLAVFFVGFLLGLPSLRVKDNYLLVVTSAFAISIGHIFHSRYVSKYSGVATGGLSIEQPRFFKLISNAEGPIQNYVFILLSTLVLFFFAHNIARRSQIGRAFRVIKCDREVSLILGASLLRYKVLAFSLSAFYAAYAGCMMMLLSRYVSPDGYTVFDAIDYYVAIVIGGIGSIFGAFIGGTFLAFEVDLTAYLGDLVPRGQFLARIFYGVLLIAIVYISPTGKGIADLISSFIKTRLTARARRGGHYMRPPAEYFVSENRNGPIKEK